MSKPTFALLFTALGLLAVVCLVLYWLLVLRPNRSITLEKLRLYEEKRLQDEAMRKLRIYVSGQARKGGDEF